MRPFYFGAPERRLFGVYDSPDTDGRKGSRIVLCYPQGQDYVFAFRAYRTLATRLARVGFPVLRFDYGGTGDSAGDIEQVSLQHWIGDVVAAVGEVRDFLGYSSVSLVGLRLGGTLAAIAAVECGNVDRLVLWEPIIQGREYVASLQAYHRKWLQELFTALPRARVLATEDELMGYRFTDSLRNDLEQLNLQSLAIRPARHILIVSQDENSEYERLGEWLRELGANVEVKRVRDAKIWSTVPGVQQGGVPNRVLDAVVSWFGSAYD